MTLSKLLLDIADSVERTPSELLSTGTPLDGRGCRCAIGAYAYDHLPEFKETADRFAAENVGTDGAYSRLHGAQTDAYNQMTELLHPFRKGANFIYDVNDHIMDQQTTTIDSKGRAKINLVQHYRDMAADAAINTIGSEVA